MFHSFDYPDETGVHMLATNFWRPTMVDGVIRFPLPEECPIKKELRAMRPKRFGCDQNLRSVNTELQAVEA
jgi:CRISPR-associated protein Cas5d